MIICRNDIHKSKTAMIQQLHLMEEMQNLNWKKLILKKTQIRVDFVVDFFS